MSLSALAARADVAKGQLSLIERGLPGGLNPRPKAMRGIADALGVPLAAITNTVPEPDLETAEASA